MGKLEKGLQLSFELNYRQGCLINCAAGMAVGHVLNDFLVEYCLTKKEECVIATSKRIFILVLTCE